jgi:hypothetical protein
VKHLNIVNISNYENLELEFRRHIPLLLGETGRITVDDVTVEPPFAGYQPSFDDYRPDLLLTVRAAGVTVRIAVEVKTRGEPAYVRTAAVLLGDLIERGAVDYGLVAVPYYSERGLEICKEYGVGCADLSGNIFFDYPGIYIERTGFPNRHKRLRSGTDIFRPKASRVLRVLLNEPDRFWKGEELASAASVSLGHVSNVRRSLRDREYIEEKPDGFRPAKPSDLLKAWSEAYKLDPRDSRYYYSLDKVGEIEEKLARFLSDRAVEYAFTMFSAADKLAPYVRYFQAHIYVNEIDALPEETLGIKPVHSGANLVVMEPYDEGVFYFRESIDGMYVADPVQIYLDLNTFGGRGTEGAEVLLKEVIKKNWERNALKTASG